MPEATASRPILTYLSRQHWAPSLYQAGHKGCRDELTVPCPGGLIRLKWVVAQKYDKYTCSAELWQQESWGSGGFCPACGEGSVREGSEAVEEFLTHRLQVQNWGLSRRDLPQVAKQTGTWENLEICGATTHFLKDLREGFCASVWYSSSLEVGPE